MRTQGSRAAHEPMTAHSVELAVQAADIDAYGHVNNAVYLTWLDLAAWSHSAALGVPLETCIRMRRGMAALRIEIDYERAALAGDRVSVTTWISACDRKLRCTRHFLLRRVSDDSVLARAQTGYVCLNLDTGRAARMPPEFVSAYGSAASAGAAPIRS
ncbi:MAG TPA: thioesterase family protein [Steroidobacteraceae bacterium]|nr:thioesterase family protein [Steroidobacteraceae bacterium]HQX47818.1 thioesterase family protein [Steroidobacteraceae bacterium]HQX77106.1 thioesterase family protein [Steroidobacteraceae bacterium]